ncbi:MAG TPA: T9SS type A sorting domain-containing protein [Ignavibacteriaceae bacterium]|nr:T9SS type A sorting domain-containing protein [Ignavibacteriaceae bacterium]
MKKLLPIVLLVIIISTTPAQVSQTIQITNFNFDCSNPSFIKSPDNNFDGKTFLAEVHRGDSSLIFVGNYNNDNDEFTVQQEFQPISAQNTNPIGQMFDWDKIRIYYFTLKNGNKDITTRTFVGNTWSDESLITESTENETELTLVTTYSNFLISEQFLPAILFQRDSSIYLTEFTNDSVRTSLVFEKSILGTYSSPAGFYMSDGGAITVATIVDNVLGQTQIVYRERNSFDDEWGFITTILDTGKIYHISFIDDYYQQFFVEADFGDGRTTYYMENWPANNQLIPVQPPAAGEISNLQTDIINVIGLQKANDFYIYGGLTYRLARNDSDFVRTNYFTYGNASEDSLVFTNKKKPVSTTGNVGFEYLGERMYTIWEDSANGYINLFGKKLILPVGAVQDEKIVSGFILEQNYPNPFNPSTNIQYTISSRQFVTLKIFNSLGEEIETLVNEFQDAGVHSKLYILNSTLPSGVYYYQLRSAEFTQTKKMLLLK